MGNALHLLFALIKLVKLDICNIENVRNLVKKKLKSIFVLLFSLDNNVIVRY